MINIVLPRRYPSFPDLIGIMVHRLNLLCATAFFLTASNPARADHFTIDLEVKAPKANRTVHAETLGLGVKTKPRAVLEIQAGDKITIKWTLASAGKDIVKDMQVQFYAVKIAKPGDPPPSPRDFDKDAIVQTALTMDFKPKDKTEGELSLQVDKAGTYLLRLETKGAAVGSDDHEHFATMDVVAR
jgi:hypothetical protein